MRFLGALAASLPVLSLVTGQNVIKCFGEPARSACTCPLKRTPRANILDLNESERRRFAKAFKSVVRTDAFRSLAHYHATEAGIHDPLNILNSHEQILLRMEGLLGDSSLADETWDEGIPYYPVIEQYSLGGYELLEADIEALLGGSSGVLKGDFAGISSFAPSAREWLGERPVSHAFNRSNELPEEDYVRVAGSTKNHTDWALAMMNYHGAFHFVVGGTMRSMERSPYDPAFWSVVHGCLQEEWRRFCYGETGEEEHSIINGQQTWTRFDKKLGSEARERRNEPEPLIVPETAQESGDERASAGHSAVPENQESGPEQPRSLPRQFRSRAWEEAHQTFGSSPRQLELGHEIGLRINQQLASQRYKGITSSGDGGSRTCPSVLGVVLSFLSLYVLRGFV